ncbi:sulfite exporter TauE/SafE family protein [bacterium]|nr:sulfite exporter TauE/SafE family protein [bacterium]
MWIELSGLFLLGVLAGVLGGYLGIGGALIITPVLLALSAAQQIPESVRYPLVFSSTLFAILGTSISAGYTYARANRVHWAGFKAIAITAFLLSFVGSWASSQSSPDVLRVFFAIFALVSAAIFVSPLRGHAGGEFHFRAWPFLLLGAATGFLSAYIGVAGGVLMVPVMLFLIKVPPEYAVGTSSMVGIVTALTGVIGYVIIGWNVTELPQWTFGYVYLVYAVPILIGSLLGGPFGSKLNQGSSVKLFRLLFAAYLVGVAVKMLLK